MQIGKILKLYDNSNVGYIKVENKSVLIPFHYNEFKNQNIKIKLGHEVSFNVNEKGEAVDVEYSK